MAKVRLIAGWVLHALVAAVMILAGAGKVSGSAPTEVVEGMSKAGFGDKLALIGWGELTTAVILLLPWTSSLGTLAASGFWGGVICTHMAHDESIVVGVVFLILTWAGAGLREPGTFASFRRFRPTSPPQA